MLLVIPAKERVALQRFAVWAIIVILSIWGAIWIAQAGVQLFTTGTVAEAQVTNSAIGYALLIVAGLILWAHLRK